MSNVNVKVKFYLLRPSTNPSYVGKDHHEGCTNTFIYINVVKKIKKINKKNSERCIIKKLLKNNTYKKYHSEANTFLLLATLTRRLFL